MEYTNYLEYKGFNARLVYEADYEAYFGEVINCFDIIHFSGETRDEAILAFHQSVEDYLQFLEDLKNKPKKKVKTKTKRARKRRRSRR